MIGGDTELVAIVGSPISQVKSPKNFNAWFAKNELNLAMIAIDMREQALDAFLDSLRGWQNLRGCVVTVPYKQMIATRLDILSERARALRSVNVIRREADGRLVGDNVDGEGFLNAARQHQFQARGKSALVVGSGGVGSAIAYALCQEGARRLTISDVSGERTQALLGLLVEAFPSVTLGSEVDSLEGYDLVVNATPVGMGGSGELPLDAALLATLRPGTLVADVVTSPEITPLLAFARDRQCPIQTGPEMAFAQMGNLGHFMGVTPLNI